MQKFSNSKLRYVIIILLLQSFLLLFFWGRENIHFFEIEQNDILLNIILLVTIILSIASIIMIKEIFKLINSEVKFKMQRLQLKKNEKLIKSLRSQKHDFINHLQTLYGMIQLDKDEKAKEYIKSLNEDLSKLEFGKNYSNNSVLACILIPKEIEATKAGLDFNYEIDSGVDELYLSLDKLFRIVSNLVDNAIEATKDCAGQGEIEVIGEDQGSQYVLSVYNSGAIIEKELLNKIFESGFSTKESNRGYGLHIIKSLVEEARGKLKVKSKEGYGTEFICYLPKDLKIKRSS